MAETMQFDLVSPERRLLSTEATSVQIPGADGDLTAMPNHAPLITTLRPGILTVETAKGTEQFVVTGGFAEIGESLSILAEKALPREDMDQATYEALVDEAHRVYQQTKETAEHPGLVDEAHRVYQQTKETAEHPGLVDDAVKLLQDMVAVGTHIGLDPKQPSI